MKQTINQLRPLYLFDTFLTPFRLKTVSTTPQVVQEWIDKLKGQQKSMKSRVHFHPSARQKISALTGRLRQKLLKITGQRQAILEILRNHSHPLTIKEIFVLMPQDRCDLATIYRATHLLEQMGMVKRFDFGDGAARFELIAEGEDGHHHHLICTKCAAVVEIEECALGKIDSQIGETNGFTAVTHKLEFFGICPACRPNGK